VVAWAGTRGVVPLAAALSIPLTDESGTPLAGRDLALVLAIAVTAISLVVQGFTLTGLVRRSGLALPGSHTEDEARAARERLEAYALSYLDDLIAQDAGDPALVERVRAQLRDRLEGRRRGAREDGRVEAYRQLWQDVVAVQSAELARMYAADQLSDAAYHQVQRQLDLEHARLADD
jgi:CPA1 family monovalent cation:H+ antiporter